MRVTGEQLGNPGEYGVVGAQDAPQQRSPLDERVWPLGGHGQHIPTVAGAQIDRYARMTIDQAQRWLVSSSWVLLSPHRHDPDQMAALGLLLLMIVVVAAIVYIAGLAWLVRYDVCEEERPPEKDCQPKPIRSAPSKASADIGEVGQVLSVL